MNNKIQCLEYIKLKKERFSVRLELNKLREEGRFEEMAEKEKDISDINTKIGDIERNKTYYE